MATILVVDDRPENREYMATLLGYRKHRLLEAADGAEALTIARLEHPDLIIADILMPTMDGYELVRKLRGDPASAHTQVIFWTAHYHEREAQALARTCSVSSVITKPSKPETILNAVEAALGLSVPAASQAAIEQYDREHMRLLTDKLSEKADALKATNERLSALVELNLQLASEMDLRRLLQNFGHAARQIIGARFSVIGILNESRTRFQYLFTSGLDAATAALLGSPDAHAPVFKTILDHGHCLRIHNPDGDPVKLGFSRSHPPARSWLGAPIASPTQVYGYIGLSDRIGLEEFSREDERLAGILAAQVGRIYQNGTLYAELMTHAADLERKIADQAGTEKALEDRVRQGLLVAEMSASGSRSNTLRGMLQLHAETLVRHLDLALAGVWIFSEEENVLELKGSAGICTRIDGMFSRIPFGESKIGRIARERTPLLRNDAATDPEISDKEWAKREGIVAFAGYPLVTGDRLLGVVGMFACHPLDGATADAASRAAHEITLGVQRIRGNEAPGERDEHVRLLLDSTAMAIYGIDQQGLCTFASPASARLLGYDSPAQLVGQNVHNLVHCTCGDRTPLSTNKCRIITTILQNQSSHFDDEVFWRADGSSFPVEYWSYPVCREGRAVGAVVAFLDISERRRLEDQFSYSRKQLHEVIDASPAVLFTSEITEDSVHGITWISDNVREVLGHPPENAIGTDWWLANVHTDDVERASAQTRAELLAGGRSTQEYRFRHGDGTYRWTRCDMKLVRDQAGRSADIVGAWLDTTDRKQAEEEQANLRRQLQQAQKLETVGRLAGGVAHDFNNLLTVINGYASRLTRKLDPDDPTHESVNEILKAGQQAVQLTRQLLLVSRKQVAQVSQINLNDVVTEVEKILARVIGEDIRLEFGLNPSLGYVLADAGQLHQVLMNLAINARDAMPAGGTLLFETTNIELDERYVEHHAEVKPGPYVRLKVSDSGIGMEKEVLSHLFEPFFTTKKAGEGTGLGLATVYGIVKQSEGSIWVYSEPGEGTTFTIYLPRTDGVAAQQQEPGHAVQSLRGTETILVVEDQDQLRKMTASVLRSYGYRVLEAANPEEALLLSERFADPVHLMLTDIVMPVMTGPELARCIKPSRPAMEVAFMSGYSERAIADRLQLVGSYLAKPFSPDALATKVREVLGTTRPARTVLVMDEEPAVRKHLRNVLSTAGYCVLEAQSRKEAVQKLKTSEVDLVVADLPVAEQEEFKTLRALRRVQRELKIIAMSTTQPAGSPSRPADRPGTQASLAKPIRPDELLEAISRVMAA